MLSCLDDGIVWGERENIDTQPHDYFQSHTQITSKAPLGLCGKRSTSSEEGEFCIEAKQIFICDECKLFWIFITLD